MTEIQVPVSAMMADKPASAPVKSSPDGDQGEADEFSRCYDKSRKIDGEHRQNAVRVGSRVSRSRDVAGKQDNDPVRQDPLRALADPEEADLTVAEMPGAEAEHEYFSVKPFSSEIPNLRRTQEEAEEDIVSQEPALPTDLLAPIPVKTRQSTSTLAVAQGEVVKGAELARGPWPQMEASVPPYDRDEKGSSLGPIVVAQAQTVLPTAGDPAPMQSTGVARGEPVPVPAPMLVQVRELAKPGEPPMPDDMSESTRPMASRVVATIRPDPAQAAVTLRAHLDGSISERDFHELSARHGSNEGAGGQAAHLQAPDRMALDAAGGAESAAATAAARPGSAGAVVQQLAGAVQQKPDGGVEVSLSPPELGKVRIRMEAHEHGMTVTLIADRGETLDLLRRNADILQRQFRELGHQNVGFQFQQGGGDAGRRSLAESLAQVAVERDEAEAAPVAARMVQSIAPVGVAASGHLDIRL